MQKDYAFVDEFSPLAAKVEGPGNKERAHYWLSQLRCLRATAHVNCLWAQLNAAVAKAKAGKTPEEQQRLARDEALPIRRELVRQVGRVHLYLLESITTAGGMGNVANWQQHVMPMLLEPSAKELEKLLGGPLPADCLPGKEYAGRARLFVPVVRASLVAGEPLRVTAIVLGAAPSEVTLCWRPLGQGEYAKAPFAHVARGVWSVTLPAEAAKADLEYYVSASARAGTKDVGPLVFPPTAPELNQTVVVVEEK